MLKSIINLFAPKKYQDYFVQAQGFLNGAKTYIGIAMIFTNQVVAPILLSVAGLLNEVTALQGLGALTVWAQHIVANPYVLKIGEAITAIGMAHKADKIITAASTPDEAKVIAPITVGNGMIVGPMPKLCEVVLPDGPEGSPELK